MTQAPPTQPIAVEDATPEQLQQDIDTLTARANEHQFLSNHYLGQAETFRRQAEQERLEASRLEVRLQIRQEEAAASAAAEAPPEGSPAPPAPPLAGLQAVDGTEAPSANGPAPAPIAAPQSPV